MESYATYPEAEQSSGTERFFKGFFTSAGKSALMMSITGILQFAWHATTPGFIAALSWGTALSAAAPYLLIIAGVGIFGGIMAAYHSEPHGHARETEDVVRNTTIGITAPAIAQTISPTLAAESAPEATPEVTEQAPQRNWTQRADIAQRSERSSIENILARGSAADHASAIAAQQQASTASPTLP